MYTVWNKVHYAEKKTIVEVVVYKKETLSSESAN